MPIYLISKSYSAENTANTVDHLKANKNEVLTLTLDFRVENFFNISEDDRVIFADATKQTPDWIRDELLQRFGTFNVLDVIEVSGTTSQDGTYCIVEKQNGGKSIRVVNFPALTAVDFGAESVEVAGLIRLASEPQAISYDFGFIENDDPFAVTSLVDGERMRFYHDAQAPIPGTATLMGANGKKSWQFTSNGIQSTVEKVSEDLTLKIWNYRIVHKMILHPLYLSNQRLNETQGKATLYFESFRCLKHTIRLRSYTTGTEPNSFQELIIQDTLGNTGWNNENLNGNPAIYNFEDITYGNGIGQLEIDRPTTFTITIDGLAEWVHLNFYHFPEVDAYHKNIDKLPPALIGGNIDAFMDNCYTYDRVLMQQGAGNQNGVRFGTDFQVFKDVQVNQAAGKTVITGTVDFGASCKTILNKLSNKFYKIEANVWGASQDYSNTDTVCVRCDVNKFGIEVPVGDLLAATTFLPHQENQVVTGVVNPIIKKESEWVANTLFTLDTANFSTITLEKVTMQIVVKSASEEAILEESLFDVSSEPIANGARTFSLNQQTGYPVRNDELRYFYHVSREQASETGSIRAYRVLMPFIVRWEYWEQLILQTIPSFIVDTAEPFGGANHDWHRLEQLGTTVNYRVTFSVLADGQPQDFVHEEPFTIKTYEENPDWIQESINTFIGNAPLLYNGQDYIDNTQDVTVRAKFTSSIGTVDPASVYAIMRMYPKENGTSRNNINLSSVYDREFLGYLRSVDGSGKLKLSFSGPTVTLEMKIDSATLPSNFQDFTISSQLIGEAADPQPIDLYRANYEHTKKTGYRVLLDFTTIGFANNVAEYELTFDEPFSLTAVNFDPVEISKVELILNEVTVWSSGNYEVPYNFNMGDTVTILLRRNLVSNLGEVNLL